MPLDEMPDGICETCGLADCAASSDLVACDKIEAEAEYYDDER